MIYYKTKQPIITFKKLERANVQHFSLIQTVVDYFLQTISYMNILPPPNPTSHIPLLQNFIFSLNACTVNVELSPDGTYTIPRSGRHPPGCIFLYLSLLCPYKQTQPLLSKQCSQKSSTRLFRHLTLTKPKEPLKASDQHCRQK